MINNIEYILPKEYAGFKAPDKLHSVSNGDQVMIRKDKSTEVLRVAEWCHDVQQKNPFKPFITVRLEK